MSPHLSSSLAAALLVAAPLGAAQNPSAMSRPPLPIDGATLERAYWHCVAADTQHNERGRRMDEAVFVRCARVSHELQQRKFDGDFGRLHAWTQRHKPRHTAVRSAE